MVVTISGADEYIGLNVIQAEDWLGADEAKKQRILNVAERELAGSYADYEIPDDAVYEFAAALAVAFNDTNKQNMNGVSSFSVEGISFTFRKGASAGNLAALIPASAKRIIGEANGVGISDLLGPKWTVM